MLMQLRIKNIALIDELTVDFTDGLNCMTGETGAGKSIIIDAIQCMLGFRTSKELIKTGCETAYTEGIFCVENSDVSEFLNTIGIEEEDDRTLILQRELSVAGRNVCRINGRLVPVSVLRQLGAVLIDIHGQNDNQSIMKSNAHISLLDAFAGEELARLLHSYREKLAEFKELYSSLSKYSGDPKERERLADLYEYQLEEIHSAALYKGEDDELNERRNILINSEKISDALNSSRELISGGDFGDSSVCDKISEISSMLSEIAKYKDEYNDIYSRIEDIAYSLDDISSELRSLSDSVTFDRDELETTEERINEINKLKRKYGSTIEEILEYADKTEILAEELRTSEESVRKILTTLESKNEELRADSEDINFARVKEANKLSKLIMSELDSLEMSKAVFKAEINFNDKKNEKGYYNFTGNGLDDVEFMISANPGEPLKPLAKIASGGELSRIMLAIKTILADADSISTLIFDEIDTGISGKAAKSVAQKLKLISDKHQVICVTHHAQIAAAADNNIFIKKLFKETGTVTSVELLSGDSKIKEIARLLDGDSESEITMIHAKELISKFRSN